MATRVYIDVAGCDRRRMDTENIRRYLLANGFEIVDSPRAADRVLAVTCAFKQQEEDDSVRRLRYLRRYGRDIVVYGCLSEIAAERYVEFADLPSVPPKRLDEITHHFEATGVPWDDIPKAGVIEPPRARAQRAARRLAAGAVSVRNALDRTALRVATANKTVFTTSNGSYNLFVSRGCSGSCSYCGIRKAIGLVHSKPVRIVAEELRRGLDDGHRTFAILGDDPGCYGADIGSSLPKLMEALFETAAAWSAAQPNPERVRFHLREVHPHHLVRYAGELAALPGIEQMSGVLCPVQSGSDRILELMRREHSADDLAAALQLLRQSVPDIELSTQIIVGFPSETEEDVAITIGFLERVGFDSVVVFPYADRERTAASRLQEKLDEREIERRTRHVLRSLRTLGVAASRSCP